MVGLQVYDYAICRVKVIPNALKMASVKASTVSKGKEKEGQKESRWEGREVRGGREGVEREGDREGGGGGRLKGRGWGGGRTGEQVEGREGGEEEGGKRGREEWEEGREGVR